MDERRVAELIEDTKRALQNELRAEIGELRTSLQSVSDSADQKLKKELQTLSDASDRSLDKEIERVKLDVENLMQNTASGAVQTELKRHLRHLTYFIAGLTVFAVIGLITQEDFFSWMHDKIKSPSKVYSSLEESFDAMTLEDISRVKKEMPTFIWDTLSTGKKRQFEEVFGSPAFVRALDHIIRNEVAQTFGSPSRPIQVRVDDIISYGGTPTPVEIVQLGELGSRALTSCNRPISNDALEAVVVIPRDWAAASYGWLGCDGRYPSLIKLRLTTAGREVDGIVLQGFQRNGKSDRVQVRVAQVVAQSLGIEGVEPFSGRVSGYMTVTEAKY